MGVAARRFDFAPIIVHAIYAESTVYAEII
jgi:hypothetical protein